MKALPTVLLSSASILGFAVSAPMAMAQGPAANDATGDEIIVTARRQSESYIDVPTMVTVASGEELAKTNANDLAKIAENIPFVQITKTSSGSGGAFVVRGIGSFATDVGISQPVLLNLDNVFVGRPRIIAQGQYDIAQVEVLKGPQALFYGKNSPAGVISILTKNPGDEFEGFVRGTYEFEAKERIIEGGLSIPLSQTLGVRLAGRAAGMDGYIKNNSIGYPNNPMQAVAGASYLANFPVPAGVGRHSPVTDDLGGRVTILWKPTADFTANLKYAYGLSHADGDNSQNELFCDPSRSTVPSAFGIPDVQGDCLINKESTHSGFPVGLTANFPFANGGTPYATTKSHLVSLNMDYDFGNIAISSITGYYKLTYRGAQNSYHDGLGNQWSSQTEDSKGFSQELRLNTDFESPFNFVAGLFYAKQDQLNHSYSHIVNLNIDPATGSYFTYDRETDQSSKTWSGFGQVRWTISDQFSLDAGVRYTNEKKDDRNGNAYVHPRAGPTTAIRLRAAGDYFNRSRTDTDWSPEATLTWKPSPSQIVYATYKQGFKSGGFSAPPVLSTGYTDASTRFDPEKARGFEIGYKGENDLRTIRWELVAYRFNYSSQQVSVFVPANLGFLVSNAGKSRVQGVEASVGVKPARGLSIDGTLGLNDAYFISYEGAACYVGQTVAQGCTPTGIGTATEQDQSGNQLPRAPKWSGRLAVSYETPLGDGFLLKLNGSGIYSSSFNASDNADPFLVQDGFVKLNASVALATADEKYELAFIGRNLTNQYTLAYAQDKARGGPGQFVGYFGRPLELAIQGTVRF